MDIDSRDHWQRVIQGHAGANIMPLVEPLTDRELDVLELLAQRIQDMEIAEKLFISKGTVNSHLRNIYGKLDVSKRREAVAEAKKIGIL